MTMQIREKTTWSVSVLLGCAALIAGQSVQAEGAVQPFVGVSVGSSGYGIQLGAQLQPNLSVRLVTNNLSVDRDFEIDSIDYQFESDIKMPQLLVDYHPTGNGFYLSGGVTRNSSSFGGLATITSTTQIGSATVEPGDVGGLRALGSYDEISPYVGLGWRSGMRSALAWQFEFGVTALSETSVTLDEVDSEFLAQEDLDAEAAIIESDMEEKLVAYPHLRIGVQYRF